VASSARESVTKTATARRRPSGKSDQADIIGGRGLTTVFARCACFVGQNRSYGKTGAESIAASHRIGKRDDLPEKWKHYTELNASYVEGGKFKKEEYSKHQAAK
jgi:hypothetical protein